MIWIILAILIDLKCVYTIHLMTLMNRIISVNLITQPKIKIKKGLFAILSNFKLKIYPKEDSNSTIQVSNIGKLRDKNLISNSNCSQKFKLQPTKTLNHKLFYALLKNNLWDLKKSSRLRMKTKLVSRPKF